jgi:hypothetical protein
MEFVPGYWGIRIDLNRAADDFHTQIAKLLVCHYDIGMKKEVSFNPLVVIILLYTTYLFSPSLGWAQKEVLSCKISDQAMIEASRIRNLPIKKNTPCLLHGKDEVKSYLLDTIKTKIPQQRLRAEETLYKAFGFLPKNFDYEKGLIDLYLDQLGGYYDPIKNHYVMANWIPSMLQTSVAVHELTHALQDQHFDLDSFMDHSKYTTDQLMARSALVEGDATAVMMDYSFEMMGQLPLRERQDVSDVIFQNSAGALLMPGMQKIPMSLKLMLLFPYTSGLRFAHDGLVGADYSIINQMFKRPPNSTEEILHPELYGQKDRSWRTIELAEVAPVNTEVIFKDTLGEFSLSALLSAHQSDKQQISRVSAGWGGDLISLFSQKDGNMVAVWKIAWDTKEDATEFCDAYTKVLPDIKKFGSSESDSKESLNINCSEKDVILTWRQL